MKHFLLLLALVAIPPLYADELWQEDDLDLGSGFVSVEGGLFRVLGFGRDQLEDSAVLDLSVGISLSKEFKSETDFEPIKIGPKIGVGFGKHKLSRESEVFYDFILKVRGYLVPHSWWIRPYLDGGPGLFTYGKRTFEIEGGGGIEGYAGSTILGASLHYKRLFYSSFLNQGVSFLLSLGYRF